jgi:hypothetical protein
MQMYLLDDELLRTIYLYQTTPNCELRNCILHHLGQPGL